MPLRLGEKGKDIMWDVWGFVENPYQVASTNNVDRRETYVREMYGEQLDEFYQKFFLLPLTKDENKQVIGGIWSTHAGDKFGKGYGKSKIMSEEPKLINRDFGATSLVGFAIPAEDIRQNPFVAGYCTFDESKQIKTFPAAVMDAVVFILESEHGQYNVHRELRNRFAARIGADPEAEAEWLLPALHKELRRYRGLNIQLTHRDVQRFMELLCGPDTEQLADFIRREIGPRIRATQGFNFVHIFNAFLLLSGVVYAVYFVDQIENFAKWAGKKDRELKVLRECMCQTSPTADMASFVFQMHIHAHEKIGDSWDTVEHLPSLDPAKRVNAMRIVDLKGLRPEDAVTLASRCNVAKRRPEFQVPDDLFPFDAEVIEATRQAVAGNPRDFKRKLGAILDQAYADGERTINFAFAAAILESDTNETHFPEDEEDFGNPER